eukprot:3115489-Rhodomonas_salina.1
MQRQAASAGRGKPCVNAFVEMEVCGQTHRSHCVPDSELRTVECRAVSLSEVMRSPQHPLEGFSVQRSTVQDLASCRNRERG